MTTLYKRYIAENRNIVYISTVIAFLQRIGFLFLKDDYALPDYSDSFMWGIIAPVFSNLYVSFFTAFLFCLGIGFYVGHLDEKYGIIRRRTSLPYAFIVFILSCFPYLTFFSPLYIGLLFVLLAVDILYSAYQKTDVGGYSFRIGFILAVGSLFTPNLLFYVVVFWMGFSMMRCFNIKVILTSLVAVLMVAWLAGFAVYMFNLPNPILMWIARWSNLSVASFSDVNIIYWGITFVAALIVIFVVFYNYANSFKDKIQVRAYISFMNTLFVFSLLLFIAVSLRPDISAMITLMITAFVYSHFFALTDKKGVIYCFIGVMLFCLTAYLYFLLEN